MQTIILLVHLFLALGLVISVLLQRSEGGALGIGGGSGGGGMGGLMTSRGSANFLTRLTGWIAGMFMVTSLVLASTNDGKLREIAPLLAPLGWDVRPQSEWGFEAAVENGQTFVENALIKARHASDQTGLPALADDSGLVVDALDGAPGLRSARYAESGSSEANVARLIDDLEGIPEEQRGAHFYCVMVLLRSADDPAPLIANGRWDGRVTFTPSGKDGFGYDPVFFLPDREVTAAELPLAIKNVISHRGQALARMLSLLRQSLQI